IYQPPKVDQEMIVIFDCQRGAGERLRSALVQNPELRKKLQHLEDSLREKGVLPPITAQVKKHADAPKTYDPTTHRRLLDTKRVSILEQENIELKAQLRELKARLERFGELSETLAEMGILPR
ncbi:VPA1267 family protein, partial [Aeromonas allosaccharophila]|uniref:VPA1267 family protein n=1 Tax=Aeromonas allosaccharophila TaxID=656 RepID=UPI003D26320E